MRKSLLIVALPALVAAADPGQALAVDRAFLVGAWTDDGNCGDATEFIRDGRFVTADGGTGTWDLADDRLTLSGRKTVTVRLVPLDSDTITVISPDGSLGRSTRCARPGAPPESNDAPVRTEIS